MSALLAGAFVPILIDIAASAGLPIVRQILEGKIGKQNTALVEDVVTRVAKHAGVEVDDLEVAATPEIERALIAVEAEAPELLSLYMAGLEGQFALLGAEQKEGGLASAWRWGWMYLLGFFWLWAIVLVPVVNAVSGSAIKTVEMPILLNLTSWFIALYMGGHTVKELGKGAVNAVKSWKAT